MKDYHPVEGGLVLLADQTIKNRSAAKFKTTAKP